MPYELQKNRTCGGCTACCKTHGIAELQNGNGEWCKKCNIGIGCSIYKQRPLECKEYQCFWLDGKYDEHDRPDRLKIVMDGEEFMLGTFKTGICNMWEVEPDARLHPRVKQLTRTITSQGIVVRHYQLLGVNNLQPHFFRPATMSQTLFKRFLQRLAERDLQHVLRVSLGVP